MAASRKRGQRKKSGSRLGLLETGARRVTEWAGSTAAFALAASTILVWLLTGPVFHYSDTWQLVINTGTTVVTFLMVFLIQRSQNKDSLALHMKLNEIVAAIQGASNRLVDVENSSEDELKVLRRHYAKLAEMTKLESDITSSHSLDEAEARHEKKQQALAEDAAPGVTRDRRPKT